MLSIVKSKILSLVEISSTRLIKTVSVVKRNLDIRLFVDIVNDQDISLKIVGNSQTVSNSVFDKLQLDCVVEPCNENLCVANGQFVKASRKAIVSVDFKGEIHKLPLHVVDGKFPTLFGRNPD